MVMVTYRVCAIFDLTIRGREAGCCLTIFGDLSVRGLAYVGAATVAAVQRGGGAS